MSEVLDVVIVAALFVLRIGLPLAILLAVGTLIERAYRRREASDVERPISVEMPVGQEQDQKVNLNR